MNAIIDIIFMGLSALVVVEILFLAETLELSKLTGMGFWKLHFEMWRCYLTNSKPKL